jgi:hypothetical protein
MSMLTLLLTAVLAYVFYSSGSTFLAGLVLVFGLLISLTEKPAASAPPVVGPAPAGGGSPIVIQTAAAPEPQTYMSMEFQPAWGGVESGHEKIGKRFGVMQNFFATVFRRYVIRDKD